MDFEFRTESNIGLVVLFCVHCSSALVHLAPQNSVYGLPVPLKCPSILANDYQCNGTLAELAEIVSQLDYTHLIKSITSVLQRHLAYMMTEEE